MTKLIFSFFLLSTFCIGTATAQELQLPNAKAYTQKLNRKLNQVNEGINRKTDKFLQKMIRHENKIKKKLHKTNPELAQRLFHLSLDSIANIRNNFAKGANNFIEKRYDAYIDTLQTSLKFLDNQHIQKAKNALDKSNSIQNKFANTEQIKTYIKERKQVLWQQLSKENGFAKEIKKMNKEIYYYNQTIAEWKSIFKDPKKIEEKAIGVLKKIPVFQKFMAENSQLAAIINRNNNSLASTNNTGINGLQTNASVRQLLQNRFNINSPAGLQAVQQQMNIAQEQLQKLKSQYSNGSYGSAADLPDFKPNPMKQKRFTDRLRFGGNYQFAKANNFFPTTADIGLQVAYKLNEKSSIGFGSAYKLGIGTSWQNIQFSHRGFGFRSFADLKLKGQFYINGGYEKNNTVTNTAISLGDWSNKQLWTNAALIGLSKKFKAGKKLNGSVLFLYDFLYKQSAGAAPFKFRVGYGF